MVHASLFRRSLLTMLAMCAVLPFIVWGASQSVRNMFNSPFLWVPLGNEARDEFWWFVESFNAQDSVIVSWSGCSIDDERLKRLAALLLSDAPADDQTKCSELFERVATGYSAVRELQEPPLELSRQASIRRLQGTLIGKDGKTSCAVVVLTLRGVIERELSIETILRTVEKDLGIAREHCHLGGLLTTGLAVDRASRRALHYFTGPSLVLVVLLCWVCLGSWRLTVPIVLVAAFGERLVLSAVHLHGGNMNAVLIVMSPFVFVLVVSSGVHLANYYKDEHQLRGPEEAAARSLRVGLLPCGLAAFTTTIGLLSLLISDIVPVREFGAYSALCMLITVALLLLVFPGFVDRWPLPLVKRRGGEGGTRPTFIADYLGGVARFVCRHGNWIILVSLAIMLVSGWGLARVRTSVDVLELLSPRSRTVRDHQWLETHVAPLAPLEIVIHFHGACELDLVERLEVLGEAHREVDQIESIGGTMSALTFLPSIPRPGGLRGTARRTVFRRHVRDARPRLVSLGYLHESDQRQSWRITVRAPALGDVDYRMLVDRMAATVDPIVQRHGGGSASLISTTYTGNMPMVVDAQQILLRELTISYLAAFAIIAVVIIVTVRSISAGLLAMLPNLFPTVVLFGAMGWLNRSLDIGALMTASVALGIAVDDTLHLLLWYRRELAAAKPAPMAVANALRHCGRAMTHTTLICGCGMLVFTLSDFEPTRQFALMMFLLLVAALVGDLFFLPALLVGPCRRVFERSARVHGDEPGGGAD